MSESGLAACATSLVWLALACAPGARVEPPRNTAVSPADASIVVVDASGTTSGDVADGPQVDEAAVEEQARIARAKKYWKPTGPAGKRFYLSHRDVLATVFWVGEPPTAQNGCIANYASAFDNDWMGAYGGCDGAKPRITEKDGFNRPALFVPKQNPYYFALPYGSNERAPFRDEVPWIEDRPDAKSVREAVKNRWIGVRSGDRTCYGQWEDVGPFCHDDVAYVMGYAKPRNDGKSCDTGGPGNGTASGIDLSPALSVCLGHAPFDLFTVDWWFVDDAHVPEGPWTRVVTTSSVRDGPARKAPPCITKSPFPSCG